MVCRGALLKKVNPAAAALLILLFWYSQHQCWNMLLITQCVHHVSVLTGRLVWLENSELSFFLNFSYHYYHPAQSDHLLPPLLYLTRDLYGLF